MFPALYSPTFWPVSWTNGRERASWSTWRPSVSPPGSPRRPRPPTTRVREAVGHHDRRPRRLGPRPPAPGSGSASSTPASTSPTRTSPPRRRVDQLPRHRGQPAQVHRLGPGRLRPRHPRGRHRRRRQGQRQGGGRRRPRRRARRGQGLQGRHAPNRATCCAGIKWVVDHGAKVVNLSLGGAVFVVTATFGTELTAGVEYAWSHGAVPVVASGNDDLFGAGIGSAEYGDMNALVVGATGHDDKVATYSSPTGNAKWAVIAPGGRDGQTKADDIYSTFWKKDEQERVRLPGRHLHGRPPRDGGGGPAPRPGPDQGAGRRADPRHRRPGALRGQQRPAGAASTWPKPPARAERWPAPARNAPVARVRAGTGRSGAKSNKQALKTGPGHGHPRATSSPPSAGGRRCGRGECRCGERGSGGLPSSSPSFRWRVSPMPSPTVLSP